MLCTMTEDRAQAGEKVFAAEQALDADQREHPDNPSAALAEAYAAHSASYDLRTSMIDDFLESKREKPMPRKKPAKKARSAAEKAAAKAAKQAAMSAEAEATADEETFAHPEEAHNPETPPRAENYFGYESAGSKAASSVSKEHSSEDCQEEYSQDGYEAMQTATVTETVRTISLSTPIIRRKIRMTTNAIGTPICPEIVGKGLHIHFADNVATQRVDNTWIQRSTANFN